METEAQAEIDRAKQALQSGSIAVYGTVSNAEGRTLPGAKVTLFLYNDKNEQMGATQTPVSNWGVFSFSQAELPSIPEMNAAIITAEASNYLADKRNIVLQSVNQSGDKPRLVKVIPNDVSMQLTSYNPWLTLLVLVPAIFGLIFAMLHMTQFARGMWVTYWYALGTISLWCVVVAALTYRYVKGGDGLIPLFWGDLFISSGVIIFAFIGSIIYVAFSMHERPTGFYFDATDKEKRKALLTVGGRVLVAPYVAMTAFGIFASTFPNLRIGAFAAFFGFFTGLWIKVVLEALNDIGKRFLSAENQIEVAKRMAEAKAEDASQTPVSDARLLRPERAFLDSVERARIELLKKEGVIGVAAGIKPLTNPVLQASRP